MSDAGCRFEPTCSRYMYQAVEKYGSAKGVWLGLKRIVRCHPWNKGGYDPVRWDALHHSQLRSRNHL